MREGRPEVDPEPGPHGRDEDVHQGGFGRVGMMDAAQDRRHERRRIGPRGVEVEALRGRKHAIEQFAIHRPAQHPHRDAVVALAPILRLAADPPLCLGCPAVPVALHRLHARDGGVERSSTTYRRLHRRLPVNHVRYASDCPTEDPRGRTGGAWRHLPADRCRADHQWRDDDDLSRWLAHAARGHRGHA